MKKLFRKIHLWLSVPFGIFITLLCFSGMAMVFEKEITEWCRPDLYFVREVKASPLPIETLMERVAAALPDSVSATGLTVYPDARRTWQVGLSRPRRASLYVNPYTGEVTGRSVRLPFFDTMFRLHRWLMGSSTGFGKTLTGISTVALVLILLTGLLMWLTNRHKPLAAGLRISVRKGWPRFWHDLHVAGGIYAFVFLMVVALTGLTWSFSWYRTGFYSLFGAEAQAASHASLGAGHGARRDVAPRSNRGEDHSRGDRSDRSDRGDRERRRHSPYAHWQEVYELLAVQHPGYRQITLSRGTADVVPAGRRSLRAADSYDFIPRRGELSHEPSAVELARSCRGGAGNAVEIIGYKPYASRDKSARLRNVVYTLHTGSWGGLLTRILTFLAALIGTTLPLTGYYLWLRRLRKRP